MLTGHARTNHVCSCVSHKLVWDLQEPIRFVLSSTVELLFKSLGLNRLISFYNLCMNFLKCERFLCKTIFFYKKISVVFQKQTKSNGFGIAWGWVNDDSIFIFGWTIPLMQHFENSRARCSKTALHWLVCLFAENDCNTWIEKHNFSDSAIHSMLTVCELKIY